jgi:hypothetical protein
MTLQGILARAVGEDIVLNASNVVNFADDGNMVTRKECFMLKILLICIF